MRQCGIKVIGYGLFFAVLWANPVQAQERSIVEQRGGKVKAVKYDDGTWQLLVEGKPYFIKGVVFGPVNIGESPDEATQQDWMDPDHTGDEINDIAYQTWVDENKNNLRDPEEPVTGDFALLKEMGVNTLRLYHLASNHPVVGDLYRIDKNQSNMFDHAPNKELLLELYQRFGIRVIVGHFMGSWTIGAGVPWTEGVDYTNQKHRENIKRSVKAMVLDHKDEPYVLMWLLGNENNISTWSFQNTPQHPEAYASLVGEIAEMIHELDPDHPVAICDGDDGHFVMLKHYAKLAPAVDIVAYNSYRQYEFTPVWEKTKEIFDRPIFISEFGAFAYSKKGEDEERQYRYFKVAWEDISKNSAHHRWIHNQGRANVIGACLFHWTDHWYMNYKPFEHNPGGRNWVENQPLMHDEYWGILSYGNGADPLMRQKRKAYEYFKGVWRE